MGEIEREREKAISLDDLFTDKKTLQSRRPEHLCGNGYAAQGQCVPPVALYFPTAGSLECVLMNALYRF